jgi:hypothetical protein
MASSFLRIAWSERSSEARFWIAVAVSILLHAMFLATWPALRELLPMSSMGDPDLGKQAGRSLPITARLAAPPAQRVPPQPEHRPPQPQEQRAAHAPKAAPRSAPVIASERARGPAVARPEAARAPGAGDFLADIDARRGSQQRPESPAQPAQAPAASAPLSFGMAGGAGGDRRNGGYFLVERMTWTDATLSFYRWNRGTQRLEVARENNLSIQLAVIKQVIALMRENGFSGDVNWVSERLGRTVEISARERDQVKLEAFLMLEFFSADPLRRPQESFQR